MLMHVILPLRAILSKQPSFFQLSFFKNLFKNPSLNTTFDVWWNCCEGILKLLKEGQSIQHHLSSPSHRHKRDFNLACIFAQLLSKGKVRDAIRLLSFVNQKGVLDPSQLVLYPISEKS